MKQILTLSLIIGFIFFSVPAHSGENYFIEDEKVLLYKVVNWWYTCLEPDAQWLCGQSLRFESHGDIRSAASGRDGKLLLTLPGNCAGQLSLFKKSKNRPFFKLMWQDPDYFPGDMTLPRELYALDRLPVIVTSEEDRRIIRDLAPRLGIKIEGRIRGLVNNRIALHPVDSATENQIRFCPEPENGLPFPILLTFIHTPSGKALARYEMARD